MTVRNLVEKEKCIKKGIFEEQNIKGKKEKNYYISIAIKKLVKQLNLDNWTDEVAVNDVLKECLNKDLFLLSMENKCDVGLFVNQIIRYAQFELKNNYSILQKNIKQVVSIGDVRVHVSADFVFEDSQGDLLITKIHRKKPIITKRGRKNDTDPSKSIELYMLQMLGKQLYPNRRVIPRIVYLASKSDKSNSTILSEFEEKEWDNVVKYELSDICDTNMIEKRIIAIAKQRKVDRECNESECTFCEYRNLCNFENSKNELIEVPKVEKAKDVVFTYDQKKVIGFIKGICRVNSCAGSGKTTVLCQRIIELIKEYCRTPEDFLLITYTEKGVKEFKEKLIYLLEINGLNIDIERFSIHTFNGFGQFLIDREFKQLGYTKKPILIDKIDRYTIISDLLDNIDPIEGLNYQNPFLNRYSAKGAVVQVSELFEKIDADNITLSEELVLLYNYSQQYAEIIMELYNKYKALLKNNNLLQFSDQIKGSISLLINPQIVEKYGFSDIIVDEFQDSNSENLYVINKLRTYNGFKSLTVCGDESQTIFSWRGSKQENIINFNKMYSGVVDIFLKHNFRSTVQISNLANNLNKLNVARIDKDIISLRDGEEPQLEYMDEMAIVNSIEKDIADGIPKNEISVIARTKSELLVIDKLLREKSIPTILATPKLLKDSCSVINMINFTKFLVDTSLDLHFAEMLQVVKNEEFNKYKNSNLKSFLNKEKEEFLQVYSNFNNFEKVNMFYKILQNIKGDDSSLNKLYDLCKNRNITNIEELSCYLNKIILFESDIAIAQNDTIYDAVVLTTAHSSKGREFKIVYGMLDKFKYNIGNIEDLDEERRTLFVLITRAKEKLILTYKNKYKNGFISEIDSCMKGKIENAI